MSSQELNERLLYSESAAWGLRPHFVGPIKVVEMEGESVGGTLRFERADDLPSETAQTLTLQDKMHYTAPAQRAVRMWSWWLGLVACLSVESIHHMVSPEGTGTYAMCWTVLGAMPFRQGQGHRGSRELGGWGAADGCAASGVHAGSGCPQAKRVRCRCLRSRPLLD